VENFASISPLDFHPALIPSHIQSLSANLSSFFSLSLSLSLSLSHTHTLFLSLSWKRVYPNRGGFLEHACLKCPLMTSSRIAADRIRVRRMRPPTSRVIRSKTGNETAIRISNFPPCSHSAPILATFSPSSSIPASDLSLASPSSRLAPQ
jgi:hypothetical protein